MKHTILQITIASAMLFAGCSEFLEPSSSDQYVPENAESLNEMLLGNAYPDNLLSESLFAFHNALDDDMTVTEESVSIAANDATQNEICHAIYTLQPDIFSLMGEYPTSPLVSWVWDSYYAKILGANAALDYVGEMRGSQEMKDYVAAQAYGLRAFYYLNLVNLFSMPYTANPEAPGVPLKLESDLSTEFTSRGTVENVYRQIIDDFEQSEALFKTLPAARQFSENYRINLPAVQLLKARAFLYMGEWEEAARWADTVVTNYPQFRLYDLTQFVATDAMPKPHYSDYTNGESLWHYGNMNDLFGMASRVGYTQELTTNRRFFNASNELLDSYVDENDLRKDLYIFEEYNSLTYIGNKLAMGKVICDAWQSLLPASGFALSVRLSEAYLILAESHAMLQHDGEALHYLNELRAHRISDCQEVTGLSGDDLIQFVQAERRRELCFEGFRWFDLRRWGMKSFTKRWKELDGAWDTYVIEEGDPAFTLPIPDQVIVRNPGLEQNPLANERIAM